jgi:hypothetical protein
MSITGGSRRRRGYRMMLRDEIRQFMVACEVILDRGMNADELNYLEHELLQYYLFKVAQKFPQSHPGSTH